MRGEDLRRAGPEAIQLGSELVAQRHPGADQVLASAAQRSERLGLVAVGLQHPEAMMIGARELAQHEAVEPVGLAARDPKPRTGRSDLVGMQGQHSEPRIQEPLDQQPVGTLDRDQRHLVAHERPAQRPQPDFVVRERGGQELLAGLVGDQHVVFLGRPIDARVVTSHRHSSSVSYFTAPRPWGTVAGAH
jgi:hypothetical protein